MKVLSVVVPAYNVEKYIRRCLDSLTYDEACLKKLDIIVVDDGGTDETYNIAKKYEKLFPGSIRVVKKENGGHGSTINVGLSLAKGRYVKVLDSDDWFNIFDLSSFVKKLEQEKADIVVSNYRRIMLCSEDEIVFLFSDANDLKIKKLVDAVHEIEKPNFFFKFSMPSMAIKTEVLKKGWGVGLPEKRFYVDQLFVAKAIISSKTYVVYDLDIYRHFIGRPEQSIGTEGFYRHRLDHEFILRILLDMYTELKNEAEKMILEKQIVLMVNTQYQIYRGKGISRKDRSELIKFNNFLRNNYEEIYNKKAVNMGVFGGIRK